MDPESDGITYLDSIPSVPENNVRYHIQSLCMAAFNNPREYHVDLSKDR